MNLKNENFVKLKGIVQSVPIFKKQCRNVAKEKLSFILKVPANDGHYALVSITLWGKLALDFRDRILKGTTISLEGSLGTWSFTPVAAKKVEKFAVNADSVHVLSQRDKSPEE